jgi:hypothetical protein
VVRLVLAVAELEELFNARFNPTVVRLVLRKPYSEFVITSRFNPTVVRLVLPDKLYQHQSKLPFQSHRGSISTGRLLRCGKRETKVSIPPWFD